MAIEGLKEAHEAAKELFKDKGLSAWIARGLALLILLAGLASALKALGVFDRYKEQDIVFSGAVYGKNGEHLPGIVVSLQEAQGTTQTTDSEGRYLITVKSSQLPPGGWATIVFEKPGADRLTKRVCWRGGVCIYHEVVFLR